MLNVQLCSTVLILHCTVYSTYSIHSIAVECGTGDKDIFYCCKMLYYKINSCPHTVQYCRYISTQVGEKFCDWHLGRWMKGQRVRPRRQWSEDIGRWKVLCGRNRGRWVGSLEVWLAGKWEGREAEQHMWPQQGKGTGGWEFEPSWQRGSRTEKRRVTRKMRQSRERERTKGQGELNKRRKDERSEDSVWRQWGQRRRGVEGHVRVISVSERRRGGSQWVMRGIEMFQYVKKCLSIV